MDSVTTIPSRRVLLFCSFHFFFAAAACGQFQRTELTPFSVATSNRDEATVSGAVLWRDTHAILEFDNSLRRFSLVEAEEEALVYDLKRIPSMSGVQGGFLRSSADGNWLLLYSPGRAPKTNCDCYLFDSSAWSCKDEVEPVAQWNTKNLSFGVGPQILDGPELVVVPRDLGSGSVLEIRRLQSATEVVRSVRIGGRYVASWWDKNEGLIVLCATPPDRAGREHTLSRIDIESGRVTRRTRWELPFKYGIFHRMPETARVLQHSDGTAGHEHYLVAFGRQPQRLLSKAPLNHNIKCPSSNGRFLAGHYLPHKPHHYLLDLANSRELAFFEAPSEWSLAVADNGRFYLTTLHRWDDGVHRQKIIVYDFQEASLEDSSGYGE